MIIPHFTRLEGKRGAEWLVWTRIRNLWESSEHIALLLSPRQGSVITGHPSLPWWSHAYTSTHQSATGVKCPMHLMGFLNLVSNGNYVRLQTGQFPALAHCDNLSTSLSLYTESLWPSVKTIKKIKRPNLWISSQLCEIRVQSSTPSMEQDVSKAMNLLFVLCFAFVVLFLVVFGVQKNFRYWYFKLKKKSCKELVSGFLQLHSLQMHKPILIRSCHQLWSAHANIQKITEFFQTEFLYVSTNVSWFLP